MGTLSSKISKIPKISDSGCSMLIASLVFGILSIIFLSVAIEAVITFVDIYFGLGFAVAAMACLAISVVLYCIIVYKLIRNKFIKVPIEVLPNVGCKVIFAFCTICFVIIIGLGIAQGATNKSPFELSSQEPQ